MILAADVKAAISIREVVSQHVELRKAGAQWRGKCPFHDGTNPTAFSVNEAKQVFLCHACGASGDVIDFVQRIHGYQSTRAAIHRLAVTAGLQVRDLSPHLQPNPPQFQLAGAELRAFDLWLRLKRNRLLARRAAIDDQQKAALYFLECCWDIELPAGQAASVQQTLTFCYVATAAIDELLARIDCDPAEFVQEFLRELYAKKDLQEVLS